MLRGQRSPEAVLVGERNGWKMGKDTVVLEQVLDVLLAVLAGKLSEHASSLVMLGADGRRQPARHPVVVDPEKRRPLGGGGQ